MIVSHVWQTSFSRTVCTTCYRRGPSVSVPVTLPLSTIALCAITGGEVYQGSRLAI